MASPKLGELWRRLTPAEQEKAFFFLYGICEFYASTDTWFATKIWGDPPCGDIVRDMRIDNEKQGYRPGARARIARAWIHSSFRALLTEEEAEEVERNDAMAEAADNGMFFVERYFDGQWVACGEPHESFEAAKIAAEVLDIGDEPEPLRIAQFDQVRGWVARNGWLPSGGLPPEGDEDL